MGNTALLQTRSAYWIWMLGSGKVDLKNLMEAAKPHHTKLNDNWGKIIQILKNLHIFINHRFIRMFFKIKYFYLPRTGKRKFKRGLKQCFNFFKPTTLKRQSLWANQHLENETFLIWIRSLIVLLPYCNVP